MKERDYEEIKDNLDVRYALYLQDPTTRFLIDRRDSQHVLTFEQFLELSTFSQSYYRVATDEENKKIQESISLTPFLDNAVKLRDALYGKKEPINDKYPNPYLDQLPSSGLAPILD